MKKIKIQLRISYLIRTLIIAGVLAIAAYLLFIATPLTITSRLDQYTEGISGTISLYDYIMYVFTKLLPFQFDSFTSTEFAIYSDTIVQIVAGVIVALFAALGALFGLISFLQNFFGILSVKGTVKKIRKAINQDDGKASSYRVGLLITTIFMFVLAFGSMIALTNESILEAIGVDSQYLTWSIDQMFFILTCVIAGLLIPTFVVIGFNSHIGTLVEEFKSEDKKLED